MDAGAAGLACRGAPAGMSAPAPPAPVLPHRRSTMDQGNSKSSPPSSTITFFTRLQEAWDIDEIHPFDIIGTCLAENVSRQRQRA